MQKYYKLFKIRELADDDEDFIRTLAQTFVEEVSEELEKLKIAVAEKSFGEVYQVAHKMKPSLDLFELDIIENVAKVQNWGEFEQANLDISNELDTVVTVVNKALVEIKSDFNL